MEKRLSCAVGMTLVELLVAMVIGLLLAGGIHQVFVGSSDSYQVNTQLARLQESGRFAMQILRQEVRGAGYLGCAQDVTAFTNTLNDPDSFLFDFSRAIYGLEATAADTWSDDTDVYSVADLQNNFQITAPDSGSDILFVRGARGGGIALYTQMPPSSADMKVANGTDTIQDNDILMITDCFHASVFQVNSYTATNGNLVHNPGGNPGIGDPKYPGNATKNLGHTYGVGSEILHVQTGVFYVRLNPDGQPSLYLKEGMRAPVELVEGVEAMRVRYGEDTSNDGIVNVYTPASGVSDWANVRSVRIGLLLRSTAEAGRAPADNNVYDVSGDGVADFGPVGDRRLRLVMSGTVGLRNRLR